jgi:sugar lactone lactonase YvrE
MTLRSGIVYVFAREASAWSLQTSLKTSPIRENLYFGKSVAASGNTVLVGMPYAVMPDFSPDGYWEDQGNVFSFRLAPPHSEIAVRGNGLNIISGDLSPSISDHTNFGVINRLGSVITRTFSITNEGNIPLNLTDAPFVRLNGGSDFAIINQPDSGFLAAGETQTFQISYQPTVSGSHSAVVSIANDDLDENPFEFTLSGTFAESPTFAVQPQSRLVLLGQAVDFTPSVTGDPVITYRWKKGTTFITNATASSYGIAVTKAADAAAYSVVADNPVGDPVSSNPAYLGLVTLNQGAQVLKIGGTLKLTCTVTAPKVAGVTVKYDWFRQGSVEPITNGTKANGAIVSGATTAALSIAKIGLADADIYTCRVTLDTPGNDPTLTNGETSVTVVDAVPVMNPIPLPATASISESIDVTVSASNLPISYSVVGLPKGLSMNTKTGRITGRPSVASKKNTEGDYIPQKITFKAKNVLNEGPGLDFYMVIEALDADVVGTFSGVVGRSSHSNFGMGGLVQITVGSTGAVSGSATLAGQKHKVVGMIDGDLEDTPEASLLIKRSPSSLGDLEMTIRIDGSTRVMSGSIRDPRFQVLQGTLDLGNSAEPDLINGSMSEARFRSPRGIALLPSGSGYIADSGNHVIRFVDTTAGAVTTLAGSGSAGAADGTGSAASFSSPEGLALDKLGNLYVADVGNATIRKITPAGVVTTFAGSAGQTGSTNGTGSAARFSQPCALCFDTAGNLYVADRGNHLIRKVTPAGVVTTLAGKANTAEHKDGSGSLANFNTPRGITYDPVLKALFVTDSLNRVIRKVTLTGKVTTYAGAAKTEGAAEGLFANTRFIEPLGIASLGDGTLIVTDTLLVQLNRNGTSGIISERLDAEDGSDHPAAVAQNPADKTIIAVHDTLHSIASYNSAEEETGLEAPFEARRSLGTVPAAEQGLYNAALITTAQASDVSYPQGSGYAQLSLGKTGIVNWAGKAADGSTLTFGTTVAENRSVPLHVMMYGKTGSLQGRCLINVTTHDIISDSAFPMDWSKIPQPIKSTSRSYKNGFMLHALSLKGGKYTPNNLHSYLGLSSSPADMMLNFAETVNPAFTQTFTLTAPNSLSLVTPAKSLTLKIDPKTGIFTGSFKEGTPAVTVPFAGILIDHEASVDQSGYGHYLVPESSAATAPILSAPVSIRAGDEP